jgi:cell wall-associated NlpC family hydrolase
MANVSYDERRVGAGNWKSFKVADRAFDALEADLTPVRAPYQIRGSDGTWGRERTLDDTMYIVRTRFANHDPGLKLTVRGGKDNDGPQFAIRKVLAVPTDSIAIVRLAMEQLGDDYTWGAAGPDEFDCSGFTQWVYEHAAGIYLPHSAYDQYHSTVTQLHDETKLIPGDLLFYDASTRPSPNHVGIYAGMDNGVRKVIDASSSADQIVYRDWNLNPLIGYGYLASVTGPHL